MKAMTSKIGASAAVGILCAAMLGACTTAPPATGLALGRAGLSNEGPLVGQAFARQSVDRARVMKLSGSVAPPVGFLDFCGRQPDQCGIAAVAPAADVRAMLYRQYYWPVLRAAWGLPGSEQRGAGDRNWVMNVSLLQPAATDVSLWTGERAEATAPSTDLIDAPPPIRSTVAVNDPLWATVLEVNGYVNSAITPREDRDLSGPSDYWSMPIASAASGKIEGDCEDYALEKRRLLIARGVSADALSLAVVRTGRGAIHAVLLIATDSGEFVLDSLVRDVRPWARSNYQWISRQKPGATFEWVAIEGSLGVRHYASR